MTDYGPSDSDSRDNSFSMTTVATPAAKTGMTAKAAGPEKVIRNGTVEDVESSPDEGWNFHAMSFYQILLRTGWIFKTESLVMPAVLDMIGGSAWLRGCLPMLNRFGQSVPPMMAAGHVGNSRMKKRWLVGTTGLMGLIFLALAVLWQWTGTISATWMSLAVLVLYAVFFASTGVNQLVVSSLQGKLIPILRRGELMTFSSLIGSAVAVFCAWMLLRRWMSGDTADFTSIFMFTGVLFIAATVAAMLFREKDDVYSPTKFSFRALATDTVSVLRNDPEFRLVALCAGLFGMMMTLFPHYQAVARTRLDLDMGSLVPWIIAQNLGVALFSIPVGWLTDRFGNRLALRFVMFGLCLVPVLALGISRIENASEHWFLIVFGLLGLTPVTMRTFNNYTLEMAERQHQPRYLSILSLLMAGPAIVASVAVGLLIDYFGYELTFILVTACQIGGFLMTFWLVEPRHKGRKMRENVAVR